MPRKIPRRDPADRTVVIFALVTSLLALLVMAADVVRWVTR